MKTGLSFLAAAVLSAFGGATSTPAQPVAVAPTSCVTITRTLSIGSRTDEVKKLQKFLGVEQTGYFGSLTRQKLIEWQISKKIILTAKAEGAGTTGPKTRAALKCGTAVVPASPVATQASTATTSPAAATSTTNIPAAQVPASGGAGGVVVPTVSPYGYTCTAPGAKPAPSTCTTGAWELSADEAGCVIWACLDSDDRG